MDLSVSKDNQDVCFHREYPSVTPFTLTPLIHIHVIQLLISPEASFLYGSIIPYISYLGPTIICFPGNRAPFFKIPISTFNYKPITVITWLMSIFPLSFSFMEKGPLLFYSFFLFASNIMQRQIASFRNCISPLILL